jgi:hypothetical protein
MRILVTSAQSRAHRAYNAAAAVLAAVLLPSMAFAQSTDFDPTTVTAKITTYVGYGIVMLAAFILGKWTLKALGVIGGK